jgi:hypothetical protein
VHLLSRNLKDLSHAFPELVQAGHDLPLDTLVDGEIVIADADGRSNFGALQERLGKARRDAAREALNSPLSCSRSTSSGMLASNSSMNRCAIGDAASKCCWDLGAPISGSLLRQPQSRRRRTG